MHQTVDTIGPPSPESAYHVNILSVAPTPPCCACTWTTLDAAGLGYEDYLSAVKIEDKWAIVCKVYQEFKASA